VDWNLRACSRRGHATYAPDDEALAARLQASTPVGEAWRCLRCGTFVPGEPAGRGPADQAPIVLRGRALRDATVLRLFAVERWVRAVILVLLGVAVLRLESDACALSSLSTATLTWVAIALFTYGAIQVAEGVGLWSLQRWGEYLAVVATSLFLPLEVYELTEKITWVRVLAFAVNIALVVYLVVSKRLFGARGGRAAYERERASESLLEVEASAAHG